MRTLQSVSILWCKGDRPSQTSIVDNCIFGSWSKQCAHACPKRFLGDRPNFAPQSIRRNDSKMRSSAGNRGVGRTIWIFLVDV